MVVITKAMYMEEPKWTMMLAKNVCQVVSWVVETLVDAPKQKEFNLHLTSFKAKEGETENELALEFVEIEQLGTVAKQQNRDASVCDWGCELLELCCDVRLFIFNGQMPSDELRDFTCLTNEGRNTVDYIVS
ncbi:unnamed protein product [Sphagnum jensenii]